METKGYKEEKDLVVTSCTNKADDGDEQQENSADDDTTHHSHRLNDRYKLAVCCHGYHHTGHHLTDTHTYYIHTHTLQGYIANSGVLMGPTCHGPLSAENLHNFASRNIKIYVGYQLTKRFQLLGGCPHSQPILQISYKSVHNVDLSAHDDLRILYDFIFYVPHSTSDDVSSLFVMFFARTIRYF